MALAQAGVFSLLAASLPCRQAHVPGVSNLLNTKSFVGVIYQVVRVSRYSFRVTYYVAPTVSFNIGACLSFATPIRRYA